MAANSGRDADIIACMVGGILGALGAATRIRQVWLAKVESTPGVKYKPMALLPRALDVAAGLAEAEYPRRLRVGVVLRRVALDEQRIGALRSMV